MKKFLKLNGLISLVLFFAAFYPLSLAAQTDTVKSDTTKARPLPKDISGNDFSDMGVAVTPSSMHLSIKPGNSVTKEISISNDTKKINKFRLAFSDFEMGRDGKPIALKANVGKYGLSRWINIVPNYVELKPQERKKIQLVISIPDEEDGYRAAWTIVTVDQVIDRPPLDVKNKGNTMAMGIYPSIGFGVYIYQNPPNVKINSVEIQKFFIDTINGKNIIKMEVKNTGDGIGYCSSYAELTNYKTGKITRLNEKKFTVLPLYSRDFNFELPEKLESGKYSAVGVVDFGSKDQLVVAELEFVVP
jgi:hypothetical protein